MHSECNRTCTSVAMHLVPHEYEPRREAGLLLPHPRPRDATRALRTWLVR